MEEARIDPFPPSTQPCSWDSVSKASDRGEELVKERPVLLPSQENAGPPAPESWWEKRRETAKPQSPFCP